MGSPFPGLDMSSLDVDVNLSADHMPIGLEKYLFVASVTILGKPEEHASVTVELDCSPKS